MKGKILKGQGKQRKLKSKWIVSMWTSIGFYLCWGTHQLKDYSRKIDHLDSWTDYSERWHQVLQALSIGIDWLMGRYISSLPWLVNFHIIILSRMLLWCTAHALHLISPERYWQKCLFSPYMPPLMWIFPFTKKTQLFVADRKIEFYHLSEPFCLGPLKSPIRARVKFAKWTIFFITIYLWSRQPGRVLPPIVQF